MIDIHSHILPGVDDGSPNWDTTVAMCRIAIKDGITHIVATPHANHRYHYDRAAHQDALEECKIRFPQLQFTLGCDFHLNENTLRSVLDNPSSYTVGDSPFLLIEFSDHQTPRQMLDLIRSLDSAGIRPIVTHPERNLIIPQYPGLPEELVLAGGLLQITANSLTGDWGRSPRKLCEVLLENSLVSFIASDAHDTSRRQPTLSKARKVAAKIAGDKVASQLTEENPLALLTKVFA